MLSIISSFLFFFHLSFEHLLVTLLLFLDSPSFLTYTLYNIFPDLAMERLALLLITGRGVVQKDHKRAVQLMTHALSQISSGQAKIGGIQALLKQLVLTYRILFLRLCDILKDKLSLAFIERVVRRIRDKVSFLSRNVQRGDHSFTFSNQGASAFSGNSSQNGLKTSVARDADSADSFVLNAISFQNKRHSDDVDVENEVDEKKRTKSGDDSREIREQLHLPDRSSGISLARSSKDSGYMKSKRENTAAVVDSGAKDGGKGPNERDSRKSGNAGNHVADISIEIPGGGVAGKLPLREEETRTKKDVRNQERKMDNEKRREGEKKNSRRGIFSAK